MVGVPETVRDITGDVPALHHPPGLSQGAVAVVHGVEDAVGDAAVESGRGDRVNDRRDRLRGRGPVHPVTSHGGIVPGHRDISPPLTP